MGRLLLLFIGLPALELYLLIKIGDEIGFLNTVGLILLTGIVGASLARWQGMGVLRKIQAETAQGRIPAGDLVDGLLILLASAVLITPGVITDVFGFLCLVPGIRGLIKSSIRKRMERAAKDGRFRMTSFPGGFSGGFGPGGFGPGSDAQGHRGPRGPIYDVEATDVTDSDDEGDSSSGGQPEIEAPR